MAVKFLAGVDLSSQKAVNVANGTAATDAVNKSQLDSAVVSYSVTQTSHGFALGDVLRYTGSTYTKAQADTSANAEVAGVVTSVPTSNTFLLTQLGFAEPFTSLTPGTVYFLSPTTAGAITATEPTSPAQVSKPILIAVTSAGGVLLHMRGNVVPAPATQLGDLLPTGAISQSFPRLQLMVQGNILTSGRLQTIGLWLPASAVITSVTFVSGNNASSGLTNQWFALFDSSRNMLRVTSDDTTTAWSTLTAKTLNLSSTYTTTYEGLYYAGICVVGTTPPWLMCNNQNTATITHFTPDLCFFSSSSLTTPGTCPNPAPNSGGSSIAPYAYVS